MTSLQRHDFGPDGQAVRCRHCEILNSQAKAAHCETDLTMGQWRKLESEVYETTPTVQGTNWRLFSSAPDDGRLIQVWREDTGVFTAFYQSPSDPNFGPSFWCSEGGEDLTGDLPTLWQPMADPPPEGLLFGLANAEPGRELTKPIFTITNQEGPKPELLTEGVWFRSSVSGLWYRHHKAAGGIAAVMVDCVTYCPEATPKVVRDLRELVRRAYLALHRQGWEEGETDGELASSINDVMTNHYGQRWDGGEDHPDM